MSKGVVLVTGANGGVGQYAARYLLEAGARDIVCQYRGERGNVDALLAEFGLDAARHAVQADLGDEASVAAMGARLREQHGSVSRLVNVAGSSANGMSWKTSTEQFLRVIQDNLLSAFLCSREFIPDMRAASYGRIVNFSSIVGFTGVAGAAPYAAAKAGLVGYTKSLAIELASRQITVNAIALGYFDTGLIHAVPEPIQADIKSRIPLQRFGSSRDVGAALAYLLSDDAGFMTGQVMHVNGGQY